MAHKILSNRWGLTQDPRGEHITMTWHGRTLLGTVQDVMRDDVCGCFRLTVRHFNGEVWPVQPCAMAVDVLGRDYQPA